MSMEQTFQQPESAERSLIAFADILWKYLKPDSRNAEEGLKAEFKSKLCLHFKLRTLDFLGIDLVGLRY